MNAWQKPYKKYLFPLKSAILDFEMHYKNTLHLIIALLYHNNILKN